MSRFDRPFKTELPKDLSIPSNFRVVEKDGAFTAQMKRFGFLWISVSNKPRFDIVEAILDCQANAKARKLEKTRVAWTHTSDPSSLTVTPMPEFDINNIDFQARMLEDIKRNSPWSHVTPPQVLPRASGDPAPATRGTVIELDFVNKKKK